MAEVRCVDGTVLTVRPVPCLDRDGVPYEVTLELLRDGAAFGEVGERCGYFLASTAARLRAVPAGEFPASSVEAGIRSWAQDTGSEPDAAWTTMQRYVPRDRELFCFRARDPDDLSSTGELRATLEQQRTWLAAEDDRAGRWQIECCAVLQAWGSGGTGVRAVLSSAALRAFLEELVSEFAGVGAPYAAEEDAAPLTRPVG